jgi:hypothetical protein
MYAHVLWTNFNFINAVSSKAKKLVDGRATLPKKFTEIEIVCRVGRYRILIITGTLYMHIYMYMYTVHVHVYTYEPKFRNYKNYTPCLP